LKANTAIGIAAGMACVLLSVILEGGNPAALLEIPALIIVIGGTGAATFASTTLEQMKHVPALYKKAFGGNDLDHHAAIQQMVAMADKARREGLLALEDQLAEVQDAYTHKGVQLVVDGTDSDLVRAILNSEIDGMAARHKANAHLFAVAGGFAPTLGIIGTVLGLIHVLSNLSTPGLLGHAIAGAFVATLYGVGSANLIFLPVANKLKELAGEELLYREMQLEGILSIQAGDNPRMLAEKLETYLPPQQRGVKEEPETVGSPSGVSQPAEVAA
jgi:chemotaxis protein MotA